MQSSEEAADSEQTDASGAPSPGYQDGQETGPPFGSAASRGGVGTFPELSQGEIQAGVLILAMFLSGLALFILIPILPSPIQKIPPAAEHSVSEPDAAPALEQVGPAGIKLGASIFSASALLLLAVCMGYCFNPGIRSALRLKFIASRKEPEVRLQDLLGVFPLWLGLVWLLNWISMRFSPGDMWIWNHPSKSWQAADGGGVALQLAAQFAAYAVVIILVVAMTRLRGGTTGAAGLWPPWNNESTKVASDWLGDVRLGLTFYILFIAALLTIQSLSGKILQEFGVTQDRNHLIGVFFSESRLPVVIALTTFVTLGAAIAEEFFFRGVLYTTLKRHVGPWPAAVAAALIFSSVHGVKFDLAALFALGLLLTWLYERTGRLLASIVMHATFNGVSLLIVRLSQS